MYSVTLQLGRAGFEDNPTTAIVLYLFRISRIGSAAAITPSGNNTLIAPPTRFFPRASSISAPLPPGTSHFLPPSPQICGSPQESPSNRAAARSLPNAAVRRKSLSLPDPLP